MTKTAAIVLAGGTGERMKAKVPKQFLELAGKPVIIHTLKKFETSPLVSGIVAVSHKDYVADLERFIKENNIKRVNKIVPGGKTRQESSFIGLKNCPFGTEFVLIHDAARPFVDDKIIEDCLAAAREMGAAAPAIDTEDTVAVKKGDLIEDIPDRKTLGRVQTPQGFRYQTILRAHNSAIEKNIVDSSDDCGLVLAMGEKVKLVDGSRFNIKITDETSLHLAERMLEKWD